MWWWRYARLAATEAFAAFTGLMVSWIPLLAIAGAGIGAVIASTNTETSDDAIASDALPGFETVTKTPEELARESFSLSLPELQAQQKIIDADLPRPLADRLALGR